MLLVGQKLRFGISKHRCTFVRFLSANQSEICWIVPRPTSRPLHKGPRLVINLKNIHKMIPGQVSRVCSPVLQLPSASPAIAVCEWHASGKGNLLTFVLNWAQLTSQDPEIEWTLTWIGLELGLHLEPEDTMVYISFSYWFGFLICWLILRISRIDQCEFIWI